MNDAPAPDIVHLDDTMVVVDKPAGLLSGPGRGPHLQDCVAARVRTLLPDALVVHRLDMATSGLMLLARGPHWQRVYSRLFEERHMHKHYVAMVHGRVAPSEGSIDLPLITDWPNRPKQMVDFERGKPSLTHYRVLSHDGATHHTRLALEPVTGRSHQLRVHLLARGHPILGDALYAPPDVLAASPRLLLHAERLQFEHPDGGAAMDLHRPATF